MVHIHLEHSLDVSSSPVCRTLTSYLWRCSKESGSNLSEWDGPQIVVHQLGCLLVNNDAGVFGVRGLQQHHDIDGLQSKHMLGRSGQQ